MMITEVWIRYNNLVVTSQKTRTHSQGEFVDMLHASVLSSSIPNIKKLVVYGFVGDSSHCILLRMNPGPLKSITMWC
jgi:hypothetical protein